MAITPSGYEMAAFLARERQTVGGWRPHRAAASFNGKRPAAGQPADARPFAAHRKIADGNGRTGSVKAGIVIGHGDFLRISQQKFTLGLTLPFFHRNQRKYV